MMPHRLRTHACIGAAALLAFVLTGCSDVLDNPLDPTGVDQETADDLAMQSAMALESAGTEIESMLVLLESGPAPVQPEHADHDTSITRGGLTFQMNRTFFDDQDQPNPHRDASSVRVVAMFRVFGSRMGPRDTTVVGRSAVHELRGLRADQDTLRFNGAATDTLRNSFRSLDGQRRRHFHWESAMTAEDVRLLKDQSNPYPLSGRITLVARAERLLSNDRGDLDRTFNAVVMVEFNGTRHPEVTINGQWRYRWDLDAGLVTRM